MAVKVYKSRIAGTNFYLSDGAAIFFAQDPRNPSRGRFETEDATIQRELDAVANKTPMIYTMDDADEDQQARMGLAAKAAGIASMGVAQGTPGNPAADNLAAAIKSEAGAGKTAVTGVNAGGNAAALAAAARVAANARGGNGGSGTTGSK